MVTFSIFDQQGPSSHDRAPAAHEPAQPQPASDCESFVVPWQLHHPKPGPEPGQGDASAWLS